MTENTMNKPVFLLLISALLAACSEPPAPPSPTDTKAAEAASLAASGRQSAAVAPAPKPQAANTPPQTGGSGSNLSAHGSSLSAQQNEFDIQINLSADVLFDFDQAVLKPEAAPELEKAAEVIRSKGKGLILIAGHTDSKGSDAYNQKLSLARAEAVKNWFVSQGLQQNYQTEGMGAAHPVAPNTLPNGSDNPEGRAKNRRVEITVNKTKKLGE